MSRVNPAPPWYFGVRLRSSVRNRLIAIFRTGRVSFGLIFGFSSKGAPTSAGPVLAGAESRAALAFLVLVLRGHLGVVKHCQCLARRVIRSWPPRRRYDRWQFPDDTRARQAR